MRVFFLILLACCTFGISNAENFLTPQAPDIIIFKGKEYSLNSNPLEPYFQQFPHKRPVGGTESTNLWRGYIAYFEIIDNQLYVTDIKIEVYDKDSNNEYPFKQISKFDTVFPNTEKVKVDWFNGILILPYGKMVRYVHMGYASTYSQYWLIEINCGNFIESRNYNDKEFIKFKNRQFEAFKKTNDYKKVLEELKESISPDETFIESFLKNYIIDYTSSFLSD